MDLRLATWEQAQLSPDEINFSIGQPHASLLPGKLVKEAMISMMENQDKRNVLQYAANLGNASFLRALAEFLSKHYRFKVDDESLFMTNGCSQALELACQCFANPGDTILVEEPAYHYVHKIFTDNHLTIQSAPQRREGGLDVDALEHALRAGGARPSLLYVIPTFNNPSGATLGHLDRIRLVQLAKEFSFKIIADEVYQLLCYSDASCPPAVLSKYAADAGCLDVVLSLGSFSKIAGPGLRLGWVQSAVDVVQTLALRGFVNSGGGLNPLVGCIVEEMIRAGTMDAQLLDLRKQLGNRASSLTSALNKSLPDSAKVHNPEGGYFLWLRLPDGCDAAAVLEQARKQGLGFLPGVRFSHCQNPALAPYLRLSFAFCDVDKLERGGRALGLLLAEYISSLK